MSVGGTTIHKRGASPTPTPAVGMTMAMMTDDLKARTGYDFARLFLTQMRFEQEGSIGMAKLELTHAKDDGIRTLAEGIIATDSEQITQMASWQQQWGYGMSH